MPGWTKEQFDNNYSIRVERYMGGHPNTRPEVRLHYHRAVIKDILAERWKKIALDIKRIDKVVVVGAAFGWGCEVLHKLTGATVIGADISDYIHVCKDTNESDEIDACISKVGLDPTTGRGLEIKNKYCNGRIRSRVTILNEDMQTEQSRDNVVRVLGGNPDWIITEDMIQDFTDRDLRAWTKEVSKIKGAKIAHNIGNEIVG